MSSEAQNISLFVLRFREGYDAKYIILMRKHVLKLQAEGKQIMLLGILFYGVLTGPTCTSRIDSLTLARTGRVIGKHVLRFQGGCKARPFLRHAWLPLFTTMIFCSSNRRVNVCFLVFKNLGLVRGGDVIRGLAFTVCYDVV